MTASRGLPSDGIFNSRLTTIIYRLFFLHSPPSTIVFKLKYALFYHDYALSIKKCSVRLTSTTY